MFAISFNGNRYRLGKQVHLMLKHNEILVKKKDGYLIIFKLLCYTYIQLTSRCNFLLVSICVFFVPLLWDRANLSVRVWTCIFPYPLAQLYVWTHKINTGTFWLYLSSINKIFVRKSSKVCSFKIVHVSSFYNHKGKKWPFFARIFWCHMVK